MSAEPRMHYGSDLRITGLSRGWARVRIDWLSDRNLPRSTVVDIKPTELVGKLIDGRHITAEEVQAITMLKTADVSPCHVALYPMLPMAMHDRIVAVLEQKVQDRDREIRERDQEIERLRGVLTRIRTAARGATP